MSSMSKNFREMSVFSFRGGESSMFLWMPNGEVEMMPELNDPDEPVDLGNYNTYNRNNGFQYGQRKKRAAEDLGNGILPGELGGIHWLRVKV